ncbi:MAG TPA: hypothetical protein ENG63_06920 [Candidatus Desulfofervidus auxilii]|uniref:Transglycosylase SLT domain-containing protein n=1 Tax=Desulfofervidus auxilii TaxID=1621989 RepID=A0A7C0YAI0_DESA2|nr:hypothetical protein [Candidatus Desulfofervidus auxilii]
MKKKFFYTICAIGAGAAFLYYLSRILKEEEQKIPIIEEKPAEVKPEVKKDYKWEKLEKEIPAFKYREYVEKWAKYYGLPQELVYAIIMQESSGKWDVWRRDGELISYGLMQITLPAARDMSFKGDVKELFNPDTNIKYGCAYLAWLKERPHINTWTKVIAGYNAGPDLKPWPQRYIEGVTRWWRKIRNKLEEVRYG